VRKSSGCRAAQTRPGVAVRRAFYTPIRRKLSLAPPHPRCKPDLAFVDLEHHKNTAILGGMNVAVVIVEAEDDVAVINNLLEALEAGEG
jgi:hypothetical protein